MLGGHWRNPVVVASVRRTRRATRSARRTRRVRATKPNQPLWWSSRPLPSTTRRTLAMTANRLWSVMAGQDRRIRWCPEQDPWSRRRSCESKGSRNGSRWRGCGNERASTDPEWSTNRATWAWDWVCWTTWPMPMICCPAAGESESTGIQLVMVEVTEVCVVCCVWFFMTLTHRFPSTTQCLYLLFKLEITDLCRTKFKMYIWLWLSLISVFHGLKFKI